MGLPLPAVPNTLKLVISSTVGDDVNVENVMHFDYDAAHAPLTLANAQDIANYGLDRWVANFQPALTSACTITGCTVTDLDTITGVQANAPGATVGSATPPTAPASSCIVTSLRSSTRSRSGRGRVYISGLPTADLLNAQHWSSAAVAGIGGAWTAFVSAMIGRSPCFPRLTVVSYYSGKVANPNPTSNRRFIPERRVTPLTFGQVSITVNPRIGSQRRRNV